MGRSRGGLTTKIHAVVDASGLPLRFALSPGQAHDSTLAGPLLDDHLPPDGFVLADKAYDAEWIRAMIPRRRMPCRSSPTAAPPPRPMPSAALSTACATGSSVSSTNSNSSGVIATRYEKLAANYLAMIKIATIRIWLRFNQSTEPFAKF